MFIFMKDVIMNVLYIIGEISIKMFKMLDKPVLFQ